MPDLKSMNAQAFIITAAFCLAALVLLSGAISLYKVIGRVTDAGGDGIMGATVSSSSPAASTTTLSQGYYILSLPANGTGVTITASYQGHSVTSSPFDVTYVPVQVNLQLKDYVLPTVTPTPSPTASPTAAPAPTPIATPAPTPVPVQPQQQSRGPTCQPTVQMDTSLTATPAATPTVTPAASQSATPPPTPAPVAPMARSPGFAGLLAAGCMLGAAYLLIKKK